MIASASFAARHAAQTAMIAAAPARCSPQPLNTVVLPPSRPGGPTLVYFLEPQPSLDVFEFGGHYVVEVSTDRKTGVPRAFTNSCIELTPRAKDGKADALVVTHLLDPVPTEIHVFSSLAAGLPVYVITSQNSRTWAVEGPRIRLVDPKGTK